MKEIRTRFAPSPTGYMHVGNLRTAIYTYLTAKHENGSFILRIEDTDQGRLVDGAVDVIYDTMRETGLLWDEGPDVGGPVGPYVQSERMGMFKKYALELVEAGKAYYCFCSEDELAERREQQIADGATIGSYDRRCRDLSEEEIKEKLANNVPYVIRQKMPLEGTTSFTDLNYGTITVNNSELEDQILIKADGMPTYNFANVVDDHLMGISHVLRGNEYLSSTPKYNLLYEAFGWEAPAYIHCPPVMKDAQNKLSKRNGDASYQDLIKRGFLSHAIVNYLLLLGWSPVDSKEFFTKQEMIEAWDPSRISKSPAIFDINKLRAMNGVYIRQLSAEEFEGYAKQWIDLELSEAAMKILCTNLHKRCDAFEDITAQIAFIKELPAFNPELYNNKKQKSTPETALVMLRHILAVLENQQEWTPEAIYQVCCEKAEAEGVKKGSLLYPLGIALSNMAGTPGGGTDLCMFLGKEEAVRRIRLAISELENMQ